MSAPDPIPSSQPCLPKIVLPISQRLITLAMLAALLIPATLIANTSEKIPVAIAYAAALFSGVCGAVLWFLPGIPKPQRSEGRALAIIACIILVATIPLMKSTSLRGRLHQMHAKVASAE